MDAGRGRVNNDLLDTSTLVDGLTGGRPSSVSVLSLVELSSGLHVPGLRRDQLRIRQALYDTVVMMYGALPVDDLVARSYLHVDRAVQQLGRNSRPRRIDLLLAATAHAHDLRLVTRNPVDFRGLDHLVEVVEPETARTARDDGSR